MASESSNISNIPEEPIPNSTFPAHYLEAVSIQVNPFHFLYAQEILLHLNRHVFAQKLYILYSFASQNV